MDLLGKALPIFMLTLAGFSKAYVIHKIVILKEYHSREIERGRW